MLRSQGISTRISKVNQQLQKLTNLIQNDKNLYIKTKQVLLQFHQQQSSEDSLNYFQIENQLTYSKGFNNNKNQIISNFSQQGSSNINGSTVKSGLGIVVIKQSQIIGQKSKIVNIIQGSQSKNADVTIKKFRPIYSPSLNKNKKESQQRIKQNNQKIKENNSKIKQTSKTKTSKSQNKLTNPTKSQSLKKNIKKYEKQHKKSNQQSSLTTQIKTIYKKIKSTQNIKTISQNRLNQSLKMHINLKKQVNMKITDLNIQKQQCQKQAQYLKSVMKIQQQQKFISVLQHIDKTTQQSKLIVFMIRILITFFSQFFNQKLIQSQECTLSQLQDILNKKNYLIRYMLKLPDIIKQDNTLCQQRCKKLFQQKYFIDHRIHNYYKYLLNDVLYVCIDNLHNLIQFLINNNVVKQTNRKMLPYQFNSERSVRNNVHLFENVENGVVGMVIKENQRQYDSQRKKTKQRKYHSINSNTNTNTNINIKQQVHQKSITNNTTNNISKTGLKRTSTQKILSPKSKIYKNYGYNK